MLFEHDLQADAVYITLRDEPCSWGEEFDHRRRVDFGPDNRPIGIELLTVSKGVDVSDLPAREEVTRLLLEHGIPLKEPHTSASGEGTAA